MTLYPVGLSRDLPDKRVMRAQVGGSDLAVWRAARGSVQAWNNRCPHRGMALSHGFVRGNTLACLYHGWHYGTSGRCKYIPAHPDLEPPETIATVPHDVVEAGGVIWVGSGGAVPETPALDPLRSLIVETDIAAIQSAALGTPFEGATPKYLGETSYEVGDATLTLLCNPVSEGTQVTVLMSAGLALPRKRALSRWVEAMRRTAEGAPG